MEGEIEKLKAVAMQAKDLLERIEIIELHPEYKRVFVLAFAHGMPYVGPTYDREKVNLQKALDALKTHDAEQPIAKENA